MAILLQKAAAHAAQIFEQDCLLCTTASTDGLLCAACAAELPRLAPPYCRRCAMPAPGDLCGRCLANPPHFDATLAAFRYAFPADQLILAFKYGHQLELADFFGKHLAGLAAGVDADLVIPLPLHPARLRERGFNQALEIARAIGVARQLPIAATLVARTRDTPAQAGLPLRRRIKNMRSAFHCNSDLSGRRIILVDDVMTSGASLDECARTLKLHGAATVTLLVAARAWPHTL